MVDSTLSSRSSTPRTSPSTSAIMRPVVSARRNRSSPSFTKQMQSILGPRIATQKNCALSVILIQFITILFLSLTIIAKNNLLASYSHASLRNSHPKSSSTRFSISSTQSTLNDGDDQNAFDLPAPENEDLVPEALDNADYDDMSPAITGLSYPLKYTTFFARFTRCKPKPCNINHWPYLGEKCFYRDDNVKDRAGHNSSIWNLVQDDWYYTVENDFACPVTVCRHQWNKELNLTQHLVLRALQQHFENETVWEVERMFAGNKYIRVNQFWGLEYKLHGGFTMTTTDQNGKESHEFKNATITIRRGFTQKYCDVSVNTEVQPAEKPIYMIVPYTGRIEQLRLFYENIKELLDAGVALRVILATHGGPVHVLGAAELLRDMQLGFSEGLLTDGHIVQVVEVTGDKEGKFSRSRSLLDGSMYAPADALLFFCDVDMIIKPQFFENCRYNTQRNYQVYFPVVYSLFPYGKKISKEHGYWRKGAFGMLCVYKTDFKRTNKWNQYKKRLKGWGMEDVLLFKEFTMHWQTSIFHAVEPNLMHRWHPKYCEFNIHIAACLGTVFQNMGSQSFLAAIVADSGIDIRRIPYNPAPVTFEMYKNDTAGTKQKQLEIPPGESETDNAKLEDLKKVYETSLTSEKGGLLAIFAKEALDTFSQANSQAVQNAKQNSGLRSSSTTEHAGSSQDSSDSTTTDHEKGDKANQENTNDTNEVDTNDSNDSDETDNMNVTNNANEITRDDEDVDSSSKDESGSVSNKEDIQPNRPLEPNDAGGSMN